MQITDNALNFIGNTPIEKLAINDVNIWAKLEYMNPSGSIKDRVALQIINDAEQSGVLTKDKTIIEASSGNMAIALTFVGNLKGYKTTVVIPEIVAKEKLEILARYGANTHVLKSDDHTCSSIHGASIEIPGRTMCYNMEKNDANLWWARQFSNASNYRAHDKLAAEIYEQLNGKIDAFVASVGTGGTIFGVAKFLKTKNPHIKIFAVEPAECKYMTLANFQVIPNITGGILQEIADSKLVDDIIKITDAEAITASRQLTTKHGLFVGVSSGANIVAASRIAEQLKSSANIVTVLVDRAERYFSSEHYTT